MDLTSEVLNLDFWTTVQFGTLSKLWTLVFGALNLGFGCECLPWTKGIDQSACPKESFPVISPRSSEAQSKERPNPNYSHESSLIESALSGCDLANKEETVGPRAESYAYLKVFPRAERLSYGAQYQISNLGLEIRHEK